MSVLSAGSSTIRTVGLATAGVIGVGVVVWGIHAMGEAVRRNEIATRETRGTPVDTIVDSIMTRYDRDPSDGGISLLGPMPTYDNSMTVEPKEYGEQFAPVKMRLTGSSDDADDDGDDVQMTALTTLLPMFTAADANHNGIVTREEITEVVRAADLGETRGAATYSVHNGILLPSELARIGTAYLGGRSIEEGITDRTHTRVWNDITVRIPNPGYPDEVETRSVLIDTLSVNPAFVDALGGQAALTPATAEGIERIEIFAEAQRDWDRMIAQNELYRKYTAP